MCDMADLVQRTLYMLLVINDMKSSYTCHELYSF